MLVRMWSNNSHLVGNANWDTLKDRGMKETDTDRKTKICHLLIQHPNASNRWKPGARDLIQVSWVGGRKPPAWAVICCLQGLALLGSWNQIQSLASNLHHPIWKKGIWCIVPHTSLTTPFGYSMCKTTPSNYLVLLCISNSKKLKLFTQNLHTDVYNSIFFLNSWNLEATSNVFGK